MSFVLLEGLDRSGKSTVAESYKKKGYKIVHMSAPDKKYFDPGYSGESYLEELVRLYNRYEGQNVVFDRTPFGELIWPQVYGRPALLEAEDLDYLMQIENNNNAERILMYDSNTEAHWQRCVDNKEPLTRQQFGRASIFYDRLVRDYGFKKKQLSDFEEFSGIKSTGVLSAPSDKTVTNSTSTTDSRQPVPTQDIAKGRDSDINGSSLDDKIELANAIKDVMQNKILKKKGGAYDQLECQIKNFLKEKLEEVFTGKQENSFSEDEIMLLKALAKRVKEKS